MTNGLFSVGVMDPALNSGPQGPHLFDAEKVW